MTSTAPSQSSVGNSEQPFAWGRGGAFLLLFATSSTALANEELHRKLRFVGLRPSIANPPIDKDSLDSASDVSLFAGTRFHIRFANLRATIGVPSKAFCIEADSHADSSSVALLPRPRDWVDSDKHGALLIVPDKSDHASESSAEATSTVGDVDNVDHSEQWRSFCRMVAVLIEIFDAGYVYWRPARLWSDSNQVTQAIQTMLAEGVPPVLAMVAFRHAQDSEGEYISTYGLVHFVGQELRVSLDNIQRRTDMIAQLAYIAGTMIASGPVRSTRKMVIESPASAHSGAVLLSPTSDAAISPLVRVEYL